MNRPDNDDYPTLLHDYIFIREAYGNLLQLHAEMAVKTLDDDGIYSDLEYYKDAVLPLHMSGNQLAVNDVLNALDVEKSLG